MERIKMGWTENAVYVHYLDHVFVRNSRPCQYDPMKREALGWLVKENEKAIWILTDRTIKPVVDHDSGLVILKADVL